MMRRSHEMLHALTWLPQENGAIKIDLPDDEPWALEVLIRFLYHFNLESAVGRTIPRIPTFFISLYAIADKYDVASLRELIVAQLKVLCDPAKRPYEFVTAMRVTNVCTADNTLWDVLLPKAKSNIGLLLANETFRELVVDMPTLALCLLDLLGVKE
jgi:hypothetical protein